MSKEIVSYNKEVGEAFSVSENGVLRVDLENEHFKKELLRQIKLNSKGKSDET